MVKIIIILMVVVMICGYPLFIYPANRILEKLTVNKLVGPGNLRNTLQNLSRFLVCLVAAYLGIQLTDVIDKVVALVGAVICAPLAMLLPTICHFKLIAKTKCEKLSDILIIFASVVTLVFCVVTTL